MSVPLSQRTGRAIPFNGLLPVSDNSFAVFYMAPRSYIALVLPGSRVGRSAKPTRP